MQKDKHGELSGNSSRRHNRPHVIRLNLLCLFAAVPPPVQAQAPVFEITPQVSTIKFDVEASVAIKGTFDKWDATLTFPSTDVNKGIPLVKIVNRVEVTVELKVRRISGPPLDLK